MIMTFEWLRDAESDPEWKMKIEEAIMRNKTQKLFHDKMFTLSFDPVEQMVIVRPFSQDSKYNWKIIPKSVTYQAIKDLKGNYDTLFEDGVFDVDEEYD